jgi:hypothetical protein
VLRALSAVLGLVSLLLWACTVHYDDVPGRGGDW